MWVFLSKCLFVKDNLGQKLRFLSKRKAEAQSLINRNSYGRSSTKIAALKNFPKFTGKHLWWSVFFNKVSRFRPAFLFKKSLEQDFFLVNFEKFLRTPFLLDISWQLFLNQGEKFKLFFLQCSNCLTHSTLLISFDTPWKHQKTSGFLMFSWGIKRDQWYETG